jgi:hypothetical protein
MCLNSHSNFFQIHRRARQRDSFPKPHSFNIYINEMEANFNSVESEPPKLVNSNIGSLLFAENSPEYE